MAINTKLIVDAANGPVTYEADEILPGVSELDFVHSNLDDTMCTVF